MTNLERKMKALQNHLKTLKTEADRATGKARRRLRRIERRTRVEVERMIRRTEPRVREAVAQAALLSRSFRVGVRAGTAAYRAGRAPRR
jgi:dsDNA-specific endonuclease/ATPase MutS2